MDMGFLPAVRSECEVCGGTGLPPEVRDVRLRGVSLPELLGQTVDEAYERFADEPSTREPLQSLRAVGLGYLVLRQPARSLSGGEVQRLKIAKELRRRVRAASLYILDEPTVGQHHEDVARLAGVLGELVRRGHSVIVVEHHPLLLAKCDWLLELGPGAGPEGGHVVGQGPPERLAAGSSATAPHLAEALRVLREDGMP